MRSLTRLLLPASVVFLATLSTTASAQNIDDALRYSESNIFGTARSLGTANTMGAIGADWTALQSNPAGLAAYRRNELNLTLGGILAGTSDASLGSELSVARVASENTGSDFNLALPQASLVFTTNPIGSRWTQLNFGVGISQSNRFEENIVFDGATPGSITDTYLDEANFYPLDETGFRVLEENLDGNLVAVINNPRTLTQLSDIGSGLAFDAEALVPDDDTQAPRRYFTDYDRNGRTNDENDRGLPLFKSGDISRSGYSSSVDLSFGGNFQEKLLVGATLGIVNSSFSETKRYNEVDVDDQIATFESFDVRETTTTDGTGIFGRIGVIYRASQALRIGLAYHSPKINSVDESINAAVTYRYRENGELNEGAGITTNAVVFEYRYKTPARLNATLGSVLGKRGFIGAEVSYSDYSNGKFTITDETDPDGSFEDDQNDRISNTLRAAWQMRVGGELNLKPVQVRAGFEYLTSPLAEVNGQGEDATLGFTGGIGWRRNRLALDAGYRLTMQPDRIYRPYNVIPLDFPQPTVEYTPSLSSFSLTVGYKLGRS